MNIKADPLIFLENKNTFPNVNAFSYATFLKQYSKF